MGIWRTDHRGSALVWPNISRVVYTCGYEVTGKCITDMLLRCVTNLSVTP